ncbi:MAG: uncharacterized protein KVP18_001050 [Porospora cf. gigantea A]|uniref:uncharacterized protein n=1 Tax=Porospora cf. gigantea A TaxID=2853593 RepID=UPI00355A75C6|nr:MAG: hypothetical protein KVP18_001050 [Porospora cf. gigantea A]
MRVKQKCGKNAARWFRIAISSSVVELREHAHDNMRQAIDTIKDVEYPPVTCRDVAVSQPNVQVQVVVAPLWWDDESKARVEAMVVQEVLPEDETDAGLLQCEQIWTGQVTSYTSIVKLYSGISLKSLTQIPSLVPRLLDSVLWKDRLRYRRLDEQHIIDILGWCGEISSGKAIRTLRDDMTTEYLQKWNRLIRHYSSARVFIFVDSQVNDGDVTSAVDELVGDLECQSGERSEGLHLPLVNAKTNHERPAAETADLRETTEIQVAYLDNPDEAPHIKGPPTPVAVHSRVAPIDLTDLSSEAAAMLLVCFTLFDSRNTLPVLESSGGLAVTQFVGLDKGVLLISFCNDLSDEAEPPKQAILQAFTEVSDDVEGLGISAECVTTKPDAVIGSFLRAVLYNMTLDAEETERLVKSLRAGAEVLKKYSKDDLQKQAKSFCADIMSRPALDIAQREWMYSD